jgi:hypothetical protein
MKIGDEVHFVEFTDYVFPPNYCVTTHAGKVISFDSNTVVILSGNTSKQTTHLRNPNLVFYSVEDLFEWAIREAKKFRNSQSPIHAKGVRIKYDIKDIYGWKQTYQVIRLSDKHRYPVFNR